MTKLNNKLFLIFACLCGFLGNGTASGDCRNLRDGTIEKLICETEPALLEVLNPGLEIPKCGEKNIKPQIISGDTPVSAVFVSCNPQNKESCEEIARKIWTEGNGATVNIIIEKSSMSELEEMLNGLSNLSGGNRLNIIPVSSPVPTYMRDPGLFRSSSEGTSFVSNPYKSQSRGTNYNSTGLMEEVSRQCGYKYESSFLNLSKFDSTYNLILQKDRDIYEELYGKESVDYFLDKPINPSSAKNEAIGLLWGRKGLDSPLMGGNFMGVPGGGIVIGKSGDKAADPEIINFFRQDQDVFELEIPKLAVGHIDEVFNIVPSKSTCGYAVLRASPIAMREFLQTRPSHEDMGKRVFFHLDIIKAHESLRDNPKKRALLKPLWERLTKLQSLGRQLTTQERNEWNRIKLEVSVIMGLDTRIKSILSNEKLQEQWDNAQAIINRSTKDLIARISRQKGAKCKPEVIDLPVSWNSIGQPILPNPVNGLAINGRYFYSEQAITSSVPVWNGNTTETLDESIIYSPLEEEVRRKLQPLFGSRLSSISTSQYDSGDGNLHCATTNVYLPCK
ncbi:protein-arginine deiminase family protein [Bacteriovoracaceae bacterium]|nr:protein-arginine deiminase family protein [Bacteriovoracaceae bacterium]